MLSNLWGRITGKDKRLKYPEQQAAVLSRVGDYVVVYPYGLYCDLPSDVLIRAIDKGVALPVTVDRPSDAETGEPVFFHPVSNSRVIMRNNGDVEVITDSSVNVTAAASVTVDSPITTFTGDVQIDGALDVHGDITTLANVIAASLIQGATLTISGVGTIEGKNIGVHTHPAGSPPGNTGVNN